MWNRILLATAFALPSALVSAQYPGTFNGVERVERVHAFPRETKLSEGLRAEGAHEWFIYAYPTQTLPVVDDFSIDRTQHLGAGSSDANVTLQTIVYQLEVGGQHPADLVLSSDTTFFFLIDTTQVDTVITTITANPSIPTTIYDISSFPASSEVVDTWPPYNIIQYVGQDADTNDIASPDLFQDSLMVYDVAADTRTYQRADLSTVPLILWQEDEAFVNGSYGADPPTIGVATFDGMDRTGYPYNALQPTLYGIADHLTSVPINTQFPAADSVYLSFFIQPVGNSGDSTSIQEQDSLRLEFLDTDGVTWHIIRSWKQEHVRPFQQIMVPIKEPAYLRSDFQMRFTNKASYGGAIDQWSIDYVRLGRNRSYTDTVLQDVAYLYPITSLLAPYTSVPYAKFVANPSGYMATAVDLLQKNLDDDDKFITWGYESDLLGGGAPFACGNYGNNIAGNARTTYNSSHPITDGPCSYTYPTPPGDFAFYHTSFWTNATPDVNQYNDSVLVTTEISNFYSYDDGSAEWGYSLNVEGGKIAYKFDTDGDDSLRAVRLYFDPIFTQNDPTDGIFLITVWNDLGQDPIFQNVSFSVPEYRRWGPDHYVEYALDSTIHVSGTFYVGWVQTNAIKMNLGLDVDRDNSNKMFYYVSGQWAQSTVPGSWMMRPVMVAPADPFAAVREVNAEAADGMRVWPNPANDALRIALMEHTQARTIEVIDVTGRSLFRTAWSTDLSLSTGQLAAGPYVVRALDRNGVSIAQQRVIVQH